MTVKRKIFLKLGPKFISIVIAVLLALLLCLGIYQVFLKSPSDNEKKPPSGLADGENENGEKTDNLNAEKDDNSENKNVNVYNCDKAQAITTPLSSEAALLCNNVENTVNLQKNKNKALSSASVLPLTVALTVMDFIEKGEVTPSERAVCPASAIRLPSYSDSSYILSVGQALTVAELVKSMLCTSPELFAYTLAIHICGSEQAFVERANELLHDLGATSTVFTSVSNAEKQTSTVMDAAVIFRAATENSTLLSLLSSRDSFTVSAGGSAWNTTTLCGRFYSECCTEGQAKADGIICGYYGEYNGKQYVYMLFEQLGVRYVTVAVGGSTAYADSLILLASIARK